MEIECFPIALGIIMCCACMTVSLLILNYFSDISKVIENTVTIAEVTHADPRCKASCVATTVAVSLSPS